MSGAQKKVPIAFDIAFLDGEGTRVEVALSGQSDDASIGEVQQHRRLALHEQRCQHPLDRGRRRRRQVRLGSVCGGESSPGASIIPGCATAGTIGEVTGAVGESVGAGDIVATIE